MMQLTKREELILDKAPPFFEMGLTETQMVNMSEEEYLAFCTNYLKENKILSDMKHWFYDLEQDAIIDALKQIKIEEVKRLVESLNRTESLEGIRRYNENLIQRVAFGNIEIPEFLEDSDLKKLPDICLETAKFKGSKKKLRHLINLFFVPLNGRRTRRISNSESFGGF